MTTNPYFEPRGADDRDLVAEVRNKLVASGLAKEVTDGFDTNLYIKEAASRQPEPQRQLLNRFWTIQLLSVEDNSEDARYSLVPNGSLDDWFRLFEASVLPFAIKHRLPKAI